MTTHRIALVTTRAARDLDDDLLPLAAALRARDADVSIVDWDDAAMDWSRFDIALLRSPWDYTQRAAEFLAWAEHAATRTRLLNPIDVVRWNVDKHYLGDLAARGVAIVPSRFVEPHEDAQLGIDAFLATHADAGEFVVKPAIGAGSRDAQRHARAARGDAVAHARRLLDANRSVLLQPYLDRVDDVGETALIYFDGQFSHAVRKDALLQRGADSMRALFRNGADARVRRMRRSVISRSVRSRRFPPGFPWPEGHAGRPGARVGEKERKSDFSGNRFCARVDGCGAEPGEPRLLGGVG